MLVIRKIEVRVCHAMRSLWFLFSLISPLVFPFNFLSSLHYWSLCTGRSHRAEQRAENPRGCGAVRRNVSSDALGCAALFVLLYGDVSACMLAALPLLCIELRRRNFGGARRK